MALRLSWFPYNERIFKDALSGIGIEIGALNHPMVVQPEVKVLYVDQLDTAGLRLHYPELAGIEIVIVNIVSDVNSLDSVITPESLDFVIANHIIEHVNDPLGTLMQFHRVLRVGGVVHLAVPDKRVTFDRDRPRTSLAHLIQDNQIPKGKQKEERDFYHYREWVDLVPQYYPETRRDYVGNLEQLWTDRYSIHLHVWEPDDWPMIIHYLNQNGYPFYLVDYSNILAPEDRNEFVLILRKEETPCSPLPYLLPEKGPGRWYAARFLRRVLFTSTLRKFLRPLKRLVALD